MGPSAVSPLDITIRGERWTTAILGCFEDPTSAVISCFCPCIIFGQNAELIEEGNSNCVTIGLIYVIMTMMGCSSAWYLGALYRAKMRAKLNLVETPATDKIAHTALHACAIAQEYRELRNRGVDPAIGWDGNMMRSQGAYAAPMMAPHEQVME